MSTDLREKLVAKKQEEARAAFASYTQAIAFNMTLSRPMVEMLGLLRDYTPGDFIGDLKRSATPYINSNFVPVIKRLEARGLVWHDYIEPRIAPKGHRYHKLTRAGELMCDLLIEAGLLAATAKKRERA